MMMTLTFPFFNSDCPYAIVYNKQISVKALQKMNMKFEEYKKVEEAKIGMMPFTLKTTYTKAFLVGDCTTINLVSPDVELLSMYSFNADGLSGRTGHIGRLDEYNGTIWQCQYMLIAA